MESVSTLGQASGLTRRTALLAGLGIAGGAGLPRALLAAGAGAKEFWDEKFPEDWTKDQIDLLLNNSPWSQKASVNFNGGPGGAGGFLYGGAVSPSERVQYEGAHSEKSPGTFHALVRWESAKPLCAAQKRTPDGAKDFYILGLTGDFPDAAKAVPDEAETAAIERGEMLRSYTKLERRGDGPLYLDHIQSIKDGELFYFSRLDEIKMANKEITFTTRLGPMEFKAKFSLKDMLYRGKLEI
jgi:hypothetical protein